MFMYVCTYVYVCVCIYIHTYIRKRLSDFMLEYASQDSKKEMRTNSSQRDTDEREKERERERERDDGGRNGKQRQRSLNVLKDWYHSATNSESAEFVRMKDWSFPRGGRGRAILSSHSHPFAPHVQKVARAHSLSLFMCVCRVGILDR